MYEEILLNLDFIQLAQFLSRLPGDISCDDLFRCIATVSMEIDKRQFGQVLQQHRDAPPVTWCNEIWGVSNRTCIYRVVDKSLTVAVIRHLVFDALIIIRNLRSSKHILAKWYLVLVLVVWHPSTCNVLCQLRVSWTLGSNFYGRIFKAAASVKICLPKSKSLTFCSPSLSSDLLYLFDRFLAVAVLPNFSFLCFML